MRDNMHIGPLIRLLNKEFEQMHAEKANSLGLTPVQLFVLHYISIRRDEDVCQRDIEKQFDLSHATVSGIISRLEAKEFVECCFAEDDRRIKKISVTQKAVLCESEMKSHICHLEEQLLDGFSEEEKIQLHSFIKRLLININVKLPENTYREDERC